MKARLLVLVLGSGAWASGSAAAQAISAGVRAGVTVPAGAYGDSATSLGTGWNVGAVGRVDFGSSRFGLQLDVGYSANSIQGPPGGVASDWQAGAGLVFLILPLASGVRPYVLAGVAVDSRIRQFLI